MSDPIEDKALDEYLRGGSPVSQRYREMGADEVPPDLDRRVLAQARAAVAKSASRSRAWMRWSAPLALAASLVMVVTIVIESGVQNEALLVPAPKPTSDVVGLDGAAEESKEDFRQLQGAPAEAAQPPPPAAFVLEMPAAPSPMKAETPSAPQPAAREEITARARRLRATQQDAIAPITTQQDAELTFAVEPEALASVPAPSVQQSTAIQQSAAAEPSTAIQQTTTTRPDARSSHDLSEIVVTGSHRRAPVQAVGPRSTIPANRASGSAPDESERDEARTHSDPERWLADIRELREGGKTAAADLEWERFRVAFPDYPVADADVAKKKE